MPQPEPSRRMAGTFKIMSHLFCRVRFLIAPGASFFELVTFCRQTVLVLAAAFPFASIADSDVAIALESYASQFTAIPVAVVSMTAVTETLSVNNPEEILSDDLEFTGRFMVTRSPAVDTLLFNEKGVAYCIKGRYKKTGDSLLIQFKLDDYTSGETILNETYTLPIPDARKAPHRFSNAIYKLFFNQRGPFESSITCIIDNGAIKEIAVMDYDGANKFTPFTTGVINLFPIFTGPSELIWTSYLRGKPDLFTAPFPSKNPKALIASKMAETSPAYSPVTGKLCYSSSVNGNMDIYVTNKDGTHKQQLTFDKYIETAPCFSPTGYYIAYVSDRSGRPNIYVMDVEGSNTRRLTFDGVHHDAPTWSPDGSLIAYTSLSDGKFDIWVIEADGLHPRKITTSAGNNEYPSWSPDGNYILFQSTQNYKSDLYIVRIDGTGLTRITKTGNAKMADWSHFE